MSTLPKNSVKTPINKEKDSTMPKGKGKEKGTKANTPQPTPSQAKLTAYSNPYFQANDKAKSQEAASYFAQPKELQEALFSLSFQGVDGLTDAADSAVKSFQDSMNISKDGVEAAFASGNIVTEAVNTMNEELTRFANQLVTEYTEASKDLFTCKTINDAFTLQGNIVKTTMESCLDEYITLNEMMLAYTGKLLKPLQEQFTVATRKLGDVTSQ